MRAVRLPTMVRTEAAEEWMLAGVAGEYQSTVVLFHEPYQIEQLPSTNLAGLIHDHHRAVRESSPLEAFADSLGAHQSITGQTDHLLPLRRQDDGWGAILIERLLNTPQHKTLSGARATTKQRDEIRGPKN